MEHRDVDQLIGIAVDCWHQTAKDHDQPTCNCFRELFVTRLISEGLFSGYGKDDISDSHSEHKAMS